MTENSSPLARLPKPLRTALLVLAALVLVVAVKVVPDVAFEDGSRGRTLYLAVLGIMLVVAVVVAVLNRRRRLGGAEAARSFRQALRSGEVPPDADRDAWRAELARAERGTRSAGQFQRCQVVRGAVLAVVALGVAVLADGLPTAARMGFVLLAIAMVGAVLLGRWAARRNAGRVEALRAKLG